MMHSDGNPEIIDSRLLLLYLLSFVISKSSAVKAASMF